ncbi:sensor histidine kinase [Actinoplanes sp. LDG1-06]|uniref:histidine kinase n=1 Tax=Paractinoplanes ovalisporus TaxID=2810368 RepID=A0ABS2A715_9ACTN|nr:histidine kinase [Actinoplanes ovalisporus]MBM2615625.1 sensor histidine kinase [Actinoplanes ovalisporus]
MRRRALVIPVVLAVAGVVTLPLLDRFAPMYRAQVGPPAYALVLVTAAATALAARWPGPALLAAAAGTSAYLVLGYPYGPILVSFGVCVYAVARRLRTWTAATWTVGAMLVLLIHLLSPYSPGWFGLAPGLAWVLVPFTLGAARRTVTEAQTRERAEMERRVAESERLRVAQEVHDVVGHGLAAIQMQADIALHLRESRPQMAVEALEAISTASAEALTELRATLTSLTGPTPGLARVEDLCGRVRSAGVDVDLTVDGPARPLPAAADVAAYRVLQEALTNVVKHAANPRARVTIRHRTGSVALSVSNQALGEGHEDGFGIAGMRRRVEELGGTLTAGPTTPGAFAVHAVIPRERP